MERWKEFLDSLDTSGGHIFVLGCLVLLAVMMQQSHAPKADDILLGGFGALLAVLRGMVRNVTPEK